jgi:hypothetical protein
MKPYLNAFFFLLFCSSVCCAQNGNISNTNALSLELGKTGLIFNLNYDHKFKNNYGLRIGAGSNFGSYVTVFSVGGGSYYLCGKKSNFLELGADIQYLRVVEGSDDQRGLLSTFVYPNYSIKTIYPSLNIGYRKYSGSLLFRIGLSPGIIKKEFIPGGYLSFGLTL